MHENTERKKIEDNDDRREFQANFNRNVPINTSYKLLKLGQFETCPTMESRNVSKTNLTRVVFADLADKFKDHQMDMHSGIVPVFAQILDDNGYPVIASQYSPQVRSMERITPYSYLDKTAKEIVIPPGTRSIAPQAFKDFTNLRRVVIPESVTEIGSEAFSGCNQLKKISIPNGVTNIPECCFRNCSELSQIVFPQNLRTISAYAFERCHSLRQLTFPDSLTSIRYSAFEACANLEQIITGPNLTKIGDNAFLSCPNLKYLYINSPRVVLSVSAFSSCDIYHLKIPAQIAYICNDAFTFTRIQILTIEYGENNQVTYSCQNGDINVGLDPQNPGQKILHYNKEVEGRYAGSLYISNYQPQNVEYSDYTEVFLGNGEEEEEEQEQEQQQEHQQEQQEEQQEPDEEFESNEDFSFYYWDDGDKV